MGDVKPCVGQGICRDMHIPCGTFQHTRHRRSDAQPGEAGFGLLRSSDWDLAEVLDQSLVCVVAEQDFGNLTDSL